MRDSGQRSWIAVNAERKDSYAYDATGNAPACIGDMKVRNEDHELSRQVLTSPPAWFISSTTPANDWARRAMTATLYPARENTRLDVQELDV